jgi:hypothetical protein
LFEGIKTVRGTRRRRVAYSREQRSRTLILGVKVGCTKYRLG